MSGFKDFSDGSVLTAAELDGYLMRQSVMRFPTTTDLTANLPAGIREVGMLAWADDTNTCYLFDGTNWVPWFKPEVTQSVLFTAGGTNVTVGNSVVASKWGIAGGLVRFRWSFTIGSTANMQSGNLAINLPTAVHPDHAYFPVGNASFWNNGAIMRTFTAVTLGTTTSCGFVVEGGTRWSTSSPTGFAAGHVLAANLVYPCSTGLYL